MHFLKLLPGVLLLLLAFAGQAQARIPITGSAYGEKVGVIHLDYTTSFPPADFTPKPENYIGIRKQFYLDPLDPAYAPGNYAYTGTIFDFGDAKCANDTCPLDGFAWSEAVGWILMNGETIQAALPAGEQTAFGPEDFAKVHPNGAFSGLLWSEKAGWIRLSSSAQGSLKPAAQQNENDFGVYIEDLLSDPVSPLGHALKGYAWSEKVGWIKFGREAGDSTAFGAYTQWVPDSSAPLVGSLNNAWFAAGENPDPGAPNFPLTSLFWPGVVSDPQSGIDVTRTLLFNNFGNLRIKALSPDPACLQSTQGLLVGLEANKKQADLTLPLVGVVGAPLKGFCQYEVSGKIFNRAGLSVDFNKAFFVRAGNLDNAASQIKVPQKGVVADGSDVLSIGLLPRDRVGNPIINVDCAGIAPCYARSVTVAPELTSDMRFDSTSPAPSVISPVKANGAFLESGLSLLALPAGLPDRYLLDVTSYAPTGGFNALELQNSLVTISDTPRIPSLLEQTGAPAKTTSVTRESLEKTAVLSFAPAITLENGKIQGQGGGQLAPGAEGLLSFGLVSRSPLKTEGLDLDLALGYSEKAGGSNSEALFVENIAPLTPSANDGLLAGKTNDLSGESRYELYGGTFFDNVKLDGTRTLWRYLEPSLISFNAAPNGQGEYTIDFGDEALKPLSIDRSAAVPALFSGLAANPQNPLPFGLGFRPVKIAPIGFSGVTLNAEGWVGYRYQNQPLFTLYKTGPLAEGVDVKDIGVQFTGSGAGQSIFETVGDRKFSAVGTAGARRLAETMRRNVTAFTAGRTPCVLPDTLTLIALNGNCAFETPEGKIAYYTGSPSQTLQLSGSSALSLPKGQRYTLILTGGASLAIESNLAYATGDSQGSLGLIVLADEKGEGGNVLIGSAPTNLVGTLYAEGSLLASGGATVQNQLFWQGSIASKNTIGGADLAAPLLPEGIKADVCGTTPLRDCARRFDMNYLRRFTVTPEGAVTGGGLFSGGGSCTLSQNTAVCALGQWPTTVTLSGGIVDPKSSLSLDPFFIQPQNRPPAPGFSLSSVQQSTEVIR